MKIGEADGAGVIYDDNGDVMLHEGETVLLKEDDFVPELLTTWGYFGGEPLIEKGPGTGYLTSERLIFIQSVETTATIGGKTDTLSSTSGFVKLKDQKKLGKAQTHDYFEILNKEILACEVRNTKLANAELVNIYILSKGEQCHMSVALPVNSPLLERFKKKTVANSNELVKNIKDYFQNTSWIYSDEEKAMLGITEESSDPESVTGTLTQAQKAEIEKKVEDMKKSRLVKGPPAQKKPPEEKIRLLEDRYRKGQISKDIYEKLKAEYLGAMAAQQTSAESMAPSMVAQASAPGEQKKPVLKGPPQPTAEPGDIDKKLVLLEDRYKKGLISGDLYQSLKNDYLKAKQFQSTTQAAQPPVQPQAAPAPQPQMPQPTYQQPPHQTYQQPPPQQTPQPHMQPQFQQPPQQAYQQPPQQRPQPQTQQPNHQQPPQQAFQQPPQQRPQPQTQQPNHQQHPQQQAYQQPPHQQTPQPQTHQPNYQPQTQQQAYQQPPQQRPQPQTPQSNHQQPPQQAYQQPPHQQTPQPQTHQPNHQPKTQQPGNLNPAPVLGSNPNPMLSQQNANKKKNAGDAPLDITK